MCKKCLVHCMQKILCYSWDWLHWQWNYVRCLIRTVLWLIALQPPHHNQRSLWFSEKYLHSCWFSRLHNCNNVISHEVFVLCYSACAFVCRAPGRPSVITVGCWEMLCTRRTTLLSSLMERHSSTPSLSEPASIFWTWHCPAKLWFAAGMNINSTWRIHYRSADNLLTVTRVLHCKKWSFTWESKRE